jgi:hypothetical protein
MEGCKEKLAQSKGHYGSAKNCDVFLLREGHNYLDDVVC